MREEAPVVAVSPTQMVVTGVKVAEMAELDSDSGYLNIPALEERLREERLTALLQARREAHRRELLARPFRANNRFNQFARVGNVNRFAVTRRAASAFRRIQFIEQRVVHHADLVDVVHAQRDRDGKVGDALIVVQAAVQRVHDPAPVRRERRVPVGREKPLPQDMRGVRVLVGPDDRVRDADEHVAAHGLARDPVFRIGEMRDHAALVVELERLQQALEHFLAPPR